MNTTDHHPARRRTRTWLGLLLAFAILATLPPAGAWAKPAPAGAFGATPAPQALARITDLPLPPGSAPAGGMRPALESPARIGDLRVAPHGAALRLDHPGFSATAGPLPGTGGFWAQTHSDQSSEWTAVGIPMEGDDGSITWAVLAVPTTDDGKESGIIALSDEQGAWDVQGYHDGEALSLNFLHDIVSNPAQIALAFFSPALFLAFNWFRFPHEVRELLLDGFQLVLAIAGVVPVYGIFFDLADAGVSALRGDAIGTAASLAAAVPVIGTISPSVEVRIVRLAKEAPQVVRALFRANPARALKHGEQIADLDRRLEYVRKAGRFVDPSTGHTYIRDIFGRTVEARGWLTKADGGNVKNLARETVQLVGRQGDESGHLIPFFAQGPGGQINVVAQTRAINNGAQAGIERTIRAAFDDGKDVWYRVRPLYEHGSLRPHSFEYTYQIGRNGKRITKRFQNNAAATSLPPLHTLPGPTTFAGVTADGLDLSSPDHAGPHQNEGPAARPPAPDTTNNEPIPIPVTPTVELTVGDHIDDHRYWFDIDLTGLGDPPYHIQCGTVGLTHEIWVDTPRATNPDRTCIYWHPHNHVYVVVDGVRSNDLYWAP